MTTSPNVLLPLDHGAAQFDAYSATLDARPIDVVYTLQGDLRARAKAGDGHLGWTQSVELRREGKRVAIVFGGGRDDTHVQVLGADSPEVVASLRKHWPDEHRTSRADVAVDFEGGTDTWEAARDALMGVAVSRNLANGQLEGRQGAISNGRTLYLGSRKSEAYVRLYEKGRKDAPMTHPGWNRFEVEIKPAHRDRKVLAASADAHSLLAWSPWTRAAVDQLFDMTTAVELPPRPHALTDMDRTWAAAIHQYGPTFAEIAEAVGWETLGTMIGIAVRARQGRTDVLNPDSSNREEVISVAAQRF